MNNTDILIERHFNKKPGENLSVLRQRYEQISVFHKDPLTAALLATSYYGMEELKMRLPGLNDMLRNPFDQEELLHAITGLIMVADGGPAEGAKAIQIYFALKAAGISLENVEDYHRLALLAIACRQARPLAEEIVHKMQEENVQFLEASDLWLEQERQRQQESGDETSIAYALLVGMREEVESITHGERILS